MLRIPTVLLGGILLVGCGGGEEAGEVRAALPEAGRDTASYAATPSPPSVSAPGEVPAAPGAPAAPVAAPVTAAPAGEAAAPGPAPAPASVPVPEAGQQDGAAILARAETAYDAIRSLQADFTQEVSVPLLGSTQRSRGTISIRRPDRFLMDFSDPDGDVIVADGQYVWMYYPSADAGQVLRGSLADGGQGVDLQREFLSDATERYRAELLGAESVAGRPAHVLSLTPRGASPYRSVKLWVDREDFLVRRFEIVEENESVRKLEMRNLRPNVALGDALFRFTPPPGAEVFSQ